ncbi:hypothetical protein [Mesorhizobium loti]|uniref:hypothetical protein n=1 Tax=Rhizobium loti TaxID=381 RepID=UPI000BAE8FBA|nr:hypothetical protein [Mesorhizobium loti]PBC14720.1 hypothetical protein CK225_18210 [Mesorhizobium loti]
MDKFKSLSDIATGQSDGPLDRLSRGLELSTLSTAISNLPESTLSKAISGLEVSPFSPTIAELQAKGSALSQTFAELQARGSTLSPTIAELQAKGSALSQTFAELQARGSTLSPTIAELQAKGSALSQTFAELQARGSTLSPTIAELQAKGSALSQTFAELQARGSTLSPTIAELQASPGMALIARATQWASQLASTGTLAVHMPTGTPNKEIELIQRAATGVLSLSAEVGRLRLSALGAETLSAGLQTTRLKLSALAGAGDVLGFAARSSFTAYEELFGNWHTRSDLPNRFWSDPEMRQRHYREAKVDPGLIETTSTGAIEVVIESGFAAGASEAGRSVALLDVAGLSVQIRSANPRNDAFSAIGFFERALRSFISKKMEAVGGPQWFKQRVGGEIRNKARDLRAAAMANGERDEALLSYLDLGDLMAIVLRADNWNQAFGYVFPNEQRLRLDLQALIATRRPTMHTRDVDAVRLVELICIISRLSQFMTGDGEWKRIADSED